MPQNVVRREARHLYADAPSTAAAKGAVDALLRLQRAEETEVDRVRAAVGLSNNEFRAIRYLLQAQREGRDTGPKDLGTMLAISNASVTNVVDRLEQNGDLERLRHPDDRRAQLLRPTPAAAAKVEAGYRTFHETMVRVMDGLSPADATIVARVLNDVTDGIESGHAP
ncbi:MarR family winged helix-turn-helix transcriptional regulator [Herbiconiux ginsengi]|uniref:DNA-binding transcriptional regulator, MarR family n=1 Tax=Herbiconiux ginsengi TaxID=381665 RepID=A0A1H3PZK9_9MICO|nr:MarR family transcriptional regulator [Herbiconiux ginsengi]SDZ06734.1 DNA-binding transcriptional regulator, MarR family [Herbiconiux ginsengi]